MMQAKNSATTFFKRPRIIYAQWLDYFSSWQASGQTQETYCLRQDLSLKAFKKHYRRYQKTEKIGVDVAASATPFIPVELINERRSDVVEVIFRSGLTMKIPSHVSLASLLKSMKPYL